MKTPVNLLLVRGFTWTRLKKWIMFLVVCPLPWAGYFAAHGQADADLEELEAFVVGMREVISRSLDLQRQASNFRDVLLADDIGNLPDKNIADALNRMPSVAIQRAQGEGRYISIRGVEPGLNNVVVNGQTIGATDVRARGGRPPPLELLSAAMVGGIEVHKTVTPDMDGHSIGGTVNMLQHSAFDREARTFAFASAAVGTNDLLVSGLGPGGRNIYEGNLGFGTRFGENESWGLFIGANYSSRDYMFQELNARNYLDFTGQGGGYVPQQIEVRATVGNRERYGVSSNLEYRPHERTHMHFRGFFTRLDDDSYRGAEVEYRSRGNRTPTGPHTGTATSSYQLDTRSQLERRETWQLTFGGDQMFGEDWLVGYGLNVSEGREQRDEIAHEFKDMPIPRSQSIMEWDTSVPWFPQARIRDPNDPRRNFAQDPDAFIHSRLRFEPANVPERVWTANLDFQRDWDLYGHGGFFKFGAKYLERDKVVDNDSIRFIPTGGGPVEASLLDLGLNQSSADYFGPLFGGRIAALPAVDYLGHLDLFLNTAPQMSGGVVGRRTRGLSFWRLDDIGAPVANSNNVWTFQDAASIANSFEDDYETSEKIWSLYAMGDIRPTDKLTVIGGLRMERTTATMDSNSVIDASGLGPGVGIGQLPPGVELAIRPIDGSKRFTSWLPNLQFRYEQNENLLWRGAITYTIGRPDYIVMTPKNELELENEISAGTWEIGELEIGNPDLDPFESTNVDFAVSHTIPGGMVTAGVFYKRIKNPIYQFSETRQNVEFQGFTILDLEVDSVRNADTGTIRGLEFTYQQNFFFLPGWLDGFGFMGNVSFMRSRVSVPERPDERFRFFRQPNRVGNVQLYYADRRWEARLAYGWQSDQLDTVGGNIRGDIFEDKSAFLDLKATFRLNENWSIFAEASNLTNDEQRRYIIERGMPARGPGFEPIGRTYMFGVNWRM